MTTLGLICFGVFGVVVGLMVGIGHGYRQALRDVAGTRRAEAYHPPGLRPRPLRKAK